MVSQARFGPIGIKTTMAKAAKVQPAPEPSLADQLRAAQQAAEDFIQNKVQELKVAHPKLPIGWLEMDLRTRMRGGQCHCECVLNILGEKDSG